MRNKEKKREYDKLYKETHKKERKEIQKRYRETHKEELKEAGRRYCREHREEVKEYAKQHKEELREYRKLYYEAHREKIKEQTRECQKRYNETHREEKKENAKLYRETHREHIDFLNANRRARLRAAEGSFSEDEWNALCKLYAYRCLRCGKVEKLSMDHVIPVSKGGTNWISNIQPLCQPCNSGKCDRTIDYRIEYT